MWPADWTTPIRPRRAVHAVLGAARVQAGVFEGDVCQEQAEHAIERADGSGESTALSIELPALERALSATLAALPSLQNTAPSRRGVEIRVVVADRWLRGAVIPWDPALAGNDADAAFYLRCELEERGCEVDVGDVVRADDAPVGRTRRVVVYPAALMALAARAAERSGLSLQSMLPLSERGLAFLRPHSPDAVAIIDDGELVFTTLSGRRLDAVSTSGGADAAAVTRLWNRMRWRSPSGARAPELTVVDLHPGQHAPRSIADSEILVPGAASAGVSGGPALAFAVQAAKRASRLDAVSPMPLYRLGLALAALALAAAGVCALQAQQSQRQLEDTRAELESRLQPKREGRPAASLTKAEVVSNQAMNAAILEINAPVGKLMSSLKPPRDIDVQVISTEWESTPNRSGVHAMTIVAETHTGTEMERYAGYVASRPGFTSATLVTHDLSDASAVYRFSVEAAWTQ